ncbi:MAG TPA: creatininase family protein [Planctomycetes bacterium]|nr:creatininase family protein [Planctomycetota bacterium]
MSGILSEMTIKEVQALKPVLAVLPVGSTEPHGPHLPYCTDALTARSVAEEATRLAHSRGAKVVCLPTLPVGNNVNFRAFPFALRIGVRTLMSVVEDIVEQLASDGVRIVVIVNGHGGNTDALRSALREIASRNGAPFVCMVGATEFASDVKADVIEHPSDHGGECETSCMMALAPHLVRPDRLADNPFGELAVPELEKAFFVRPWHIHVPRSAGGETRNSSAVKGRRILDAASLGLARLLVELASARPTPSFPYKKRPVRPPRKKRGT